jgi:hypothetical protein
MTSKEFVQWLKGFTEGVHEYAITPKQWDLLKERLNEVSDEPKTVFPFGTPNGTYIPSSAITTTPGNTSITFTTGSNVTYTTSGTPNWYTTYFADLNDKTND